MKREDLVEAWFNNVQLLQRSWRQCSHMQLSGEHLTVGQLGILLYVQAHQPVSSKQIAADIGITKGAVAQFLESVERLGFVAREVDPTDRRIVYVNLSQAGEAKAGILQTRRKAFFAKLAEDLDDEEMRMLVSVQEKMLRRIERLSQDGSDGAAETCGDGSAYG